MFDRELAKEILNPVAVKFQATIAGESL